VKNLKSGGKIKRDSEW